MPWRQLILEVGESESERVEQALLDTRAVLESAPGTTPLWSRTRLKALYGVEVDLRRVKADLRGALDLEELPRHTEEILGDRAWEREWLEDFHPRRFGERLWVCPTGQDLDAPGAVIVRLDPGLAFGTGMHPTTALCLEWLDAAPPAGARVLDYGCGSGILAIAAAHLGAGSVVAVDIDPQALEATRRNAERNSVADRIEIITEATEPAFDVILANILANPLVALAPKFAHLARTGADLVLCGTFRSQYGQVARAYETWFDMDRREVGNGWVRVLAKRNATPGA